MGDLKPNKVDKLLRLQNQFNQELPERLAEIERLWHACSKNGNDHAVADLHRSVHSLAGSAGTFGFNRLGARARELELEIQKSTTNLHGPDMEAAYEQAMTDLKTLSAQGADTTFKSKVDESGSIASVSDDKRQSLVYLLEDDATLAEETAIQLRHFEYQVKTFYNVADLKAAVSRQIPDALLADINLPEGAHAGPQVAEELRSGASENIPVIFVSGQDSWQDRLSAVRAGGQAYLSKPLNFSVVVEQLDAVIGHRQEECYRILIVDDTELLARHYAAVLESAGMHAHVVNDPTQILHVLADFTPDLILMDVYMPGCTGVEAAQVIRQHEGYTNIPIVYLSTEKALHQQLEALRVGGDDFLQKPISDTHLISAVRIRARRFRELTSLMNRDSLTGLLNHINLKLALERELAQAQRRKYDLSFVMVDIDRFKFINDTYGHPVGDRVIKSLSRLLSMRLRKGDIVARYGGEEFAIILPYTNSGDANIVVDKLREQFSEIVHTHENGEFSVTFSAGIATFPMFQEMDDLIAAADKALYDAKHGGRNRVVNVTS